MFQIDENIAPQLAFHTQAFRKRRYAPADLARCVQVRVVSENQGVLTHVPRYGQRVQTGPNVPIHFSANSECVRKRDDVASDMAVYAYVLREGIYVAIHRAFDSN